MRWNRVTRAAWARTRAIAERLERFFASVERDGRWPVVEPRGPGWEDEAPASLLRGLGVVRAVDPFLAAPPASGLQYLRLHGRPAYNHRYAYGDADLETLESLLDTGRPARVLFNNDRMAADARRFRRRLRG